MIWTEQRIESFIAQIESSTGLLVLRTEPAVANAVYIFIVGTAVAELCELTIRYVKGEYRLESVLDRWETESGANYSNSFASVFSRLLKVPARL